MNITGIRQPALIILAAGAGVFLGSTTPLGSAPAAVTEVFLILLLYVLFMTVDTRLVRESFSNLRFTVSAAAVNFIFTPVLAYVLGTVFFPDSADLRIGLLMLLATPCTDWYIVFTGLSRGNVELSLSILPLNLALQILLLPVYLFLFMGGSVGIDAVSLLESAAPVLAIPLIAAAATRKISGRASRFAAARKDGLQILFLCLAVAVMFASESGPLLDNVSLLLSLFVPLMIFFASAFAAAQCTGKMLGFPRRDTVSLSFTVLARNSPLALAVAVAAFPDRPLISLALVIGPLIELPVLSFISWILVGRSPGAGCPDNG